MPRGIETLRRLAELKVESGNVLSVYVDLDPSRLPNEGARQTEIESLLSEAGKKAGDLDKESAQGLEEDIQRVRSFFNNEFSAKGVRAVAVFSSASADLFEAIPLPASVESTAVVDRSPYVEPLTGLLPVDDWCVFLVNRRTARILRGTRDELRQRAEVADDVPGQHDTGGRSQQRYERHIEKIVDDHVKHACDVLFEMYKRSPFDRLLIGCAEEMLPEVEGNLHDYLAQRYVGRFDVDIENTSWAEVLEAARPAIEQDERRREDEVLERLNEGLGRNEGAAAGPDGVLTALFERRVGSLILQPGTQVPGVACTSCDWVGAGGSTCPIDGTSTEPHEDMTEKAVELALGQSADIVLLRHTPNELAEHGGMAALLRF
ncbi:MAG TPA: Vms1/Ankzf1 family peptidyl-tRNA hydrolase [Actinomycetota bacterium]|nr:Vms1/Ankzf1 family peptidyl-tRNA hydrolase [Actinomycetota bacterium]